MALALPTTDLWAQFCAETGAVGLGGVSWTNEGPNNGIAAVGTNYAEVLTNTLAGNAVVGKLAGTPTHLQGIDDFPSAQSDVTVYLLAKTVSGSSVSDIFLTTGNDSIKISGSTTQIRVTYKGRTATRSGTFTGWVMIRLVATASQLKVTINSTVSSSHTNGETGGLSAGKLNVFSDNAGANTGDKQIAEFAIYTTAHNDATALAIEDLFYAEYGALNETTTVLNFPALPTKTVGDADFAPGATSNSPASITYTSSNPAVATIVSGNIHIVGTGTTTITAIQGSASGYTDPADETEILTVNPAPVVVPSTAYPTGLIFLDSADVWLNYGLAVTSGTADFLKYAPRKQSITNDWSDRNGVDMDVSTPLFAARDINLTCVIIAENEAEFWQCRDSLITKLQEPGFHHLYLKQHDRIYDIVYKDSSNPQQVKSLRGIPLNSVVFRFTLSLTEPEPSLVSVPTALVDEDGKILII